MKQTPKEKVLSFPIVAFVLLAVSLLEAVIIYQGNYLETVKNNSIEKESTAKLRRMERNIQIVGGKLDGLIDAVDEAIALQEKE